MKKGWILQSCPTNSRSSTGSAKWNTDAVVQLLIQRKDINPDAIAVAKAFGITAYGFFCYSVKVWDQYK